MSNSRHNSKTEGLSNEGLKTIMASVAEVVKQTKINEKSDHSNLSQIKHNVPILKSDNIKLIIFQTKRGMKYGAL